MNPDQALQHLLQDDDNFDGQGIEARQGGVVAPDGGSAFYTGVKRQRNLPGPCRPIDTCSIERERPQKNSEPIARILLKSGHTAESSITPHKSGRNGKGSMARAEAETALGG